MTIKIDLKIFAFILLFFISGQSNIYLILLAFAIIHELGHLVCGLIFGLKPLSIKIMPVGLSILFDKTNVKWWKELLIAVSGPLLNITLAIIFFFCDDFTKRETFIYANILIGVFNLFPIIPLDGGRILKSVLKKICEEEAEKYTYKISNAVIIILTAIASIGTFYLKNIAIPVIMAYIWIIAIKENKSYK